MVNLTRIYTRTGDKGSTRLANNSLVAKTDPRVDAYGQVDEANCAIGVALTLTDINDDLTGVLEFIQNELFDVGADLANPVESNPKYEPLRIIQSSIDRLENWCDTFGESLPNLTSFVLPGGTPLAAQLNVARTITRRAERTAWLAAESHGLDEPDHHVEGGVSILAIRYLNRLSDLLFILGRYANQLNDTDEVLWISGGDRHAEGLASRKKRA